MLQPKSERPRKFFTQKLFWIAIITLLSIFSAACGSSSSSNQNISAAQAQAISQQIVTTLQGALTSVSSGLNRPREQRPSLATAIHDANPAQSTGCTTNASGTTCNIPITYSGACPSGGTIGVSGDLMFTLDNSGDGSDSTSITVTPTNCVVSNLTVNGNPSVTAATEVNITNNQIDFPLTLTESGGISYGPNPKGSCSLNVTLTITSQTSCTVSGTVCGQSVNGSC